MFVHTNSSKGGWSTPISKIISSIFAVILFVLPSFVQNKITRTRTTPRRLGPTSFLDGLRGIAAVIVFFHHDTDFSAPFLNFAYGAHPFKTFLQLPFIRLWCSGQPMVHLFFIISGYVLSIKPVRLIREGSWDKLAESLASSVFRRGFRLFLPSIAGLAFFELTISMGLQFVGHGFLPRVQVLLYSWNWDAPHKGLLHLWTIPVEFSSSLFLFLCILALSRLRQRIRIGAMLLIMAYCLNSGHWAPAEFMSGMFLAEMEESRAASAKAKEYLVPCVDLGRLSSDSNGRANSVSSSSTIANDSIQDSEDLLEDKEAQQPRCKHCSNGSNGRIALHEIMWLTILIIALYVAGWSKYKREEEPILGKLILPLIPRAYYTPANYDTLLAFPFAFTAFFIVWSLFRLGPMAQSPFNSPLAQYFGDISYSFYIVHDFLLVGWPRYWLAMVANKITSGRDTPTKASISVLIELAMLMVIIIWLADVFWRLIDRPSVRFARWLEGKCRITSGQQESNSAASTRSILLS